MADTATRTLTIVNEQGLPARASAKLAELVEDYSAEAEVSQDGLTASGESLMGLLMLAASRGTQIDVVTRGTAAQDLLDAIEALVADRFGEEM